MARASRAGPAAPAHREATYPQASSHRSSPVTIPTTTQAHLQVAPDRGRVPLQRRQPQIAVARLEPSDRRLGGPHPCCHLGLRQAESLSFPGQLGHDLPTLVGKAVESGEQGTPLAHSSNSIAETI